MEKAIILAVDDNAVNLATIEQTLEDEYEVIPMIAGARAVKYLSRAQADLMLLDIQMPEMDGIQTLEEIRKLDNGRTLPVIFLTAADDEHVAQQGSQLGIMDYIVKPFDGADLKRRIRQVLERNNGDNL
ncbi:MAG: response regulator [Butyrivibrio sp.]|nr:response regulator [Muribaculum sp.]MCM1553827.1 response regulator [Butyrivibrio sp.]